MFNVSSLSTSSQMVVGVLLMIVIALTVYELWDIALARWFR